VDGVVVVALVVGPVLAVLVVTVLLVRRISRRAAAAMTQVGMGVRENASSLGFASLGKAQVRGNCTLGLDATRLVVAQWHPARTTEIPFDRIVEVDTTRTHLGKWVGRELLRVRFRRADGSEDVVALQVRDVQSWVTELRGRATGPPPRPEFA